MDDTKVSQHASHFSQMDTEYLLGLWSSADTGSYTPEGMEALRQVLHQRLGLLPQQGVQYTPHETYFEQSRLETVSDRLDTLSSLFLIIAALAALAFLAALVSVGVNIASNAGAFLDLLDVTYSIASVLPFLQAAFVAIAFVYLLRGASQALLILADIEANTRLNADAQTSSPKPAA
jgi:hypothetical protein